MSGFDEFLAGGYFLTRPFERDDTYMSIELLPRHIATLSACLTDVALEYWWNESNVQEASLFGVPTDRYATLIAWYTAQFGKTLGAPGVAFSTAVIREFVDRFVPNPDGLTLLGAGLARDQAELLMQDHRAPADQGEYGVIEMLDRRVPLEPGGETIGFEVLSYEYGLEHSWLCNSLEKDVHARLGIAPNDQGLIDDLDEAAAAAAYINRDDVGAEPGLWLPWLIVGFPIPE